MNDKKDQRGARPQPQARAPIQRKMNGNKKRSRNQEEEDDYYDNDNGNDDGSESSDDEDPSEGGNNDDDDGSSTDWSSDDDQPNAKDSGEDDKEEEEINPNVPLYQLIRERQQKQKSATQLPPTTNRTKKLKKIIHKSSESGSDSEKSSDEGRKRKNAPAEMRSDRPVKRLRIDADNSKRKFLDPRFMDYTGELSSKHYLNNYQFIEDIKEKELETITKKYKKLKNETMKQELKQEMNKIKQQLNERKLSKTAMNKFDDLIHQEKEKQKTLGKKPFYFKNSLKKDLLNEERYQHLKKEKKLKKFLDRKSKKIAVREKKSIPQQRHFRSNEE